ncbi:hypothetical protein Ciccas_008029 [Cichlidogyrus casuarinus]|uniref:Uncharacterized protein n=1 Tax=Cichlidogyrus casuarinus TaxID=1844966 RepID=A0ABD2Q1W7_9PLAT
MQAVKRVLSGQSIADHQDATFKPVFIDLILWCFPAFSTTALFGFRSQVQEKKLNSFFAQLRINFQKAFVVHPGAAWQEERGWSDLNSTIFCLSNLENLVVAVKKFKELGILQRDIDAKFGDNLHIVDLAHALSGFSSQDA